MGDPAGIGPELCLKLCADEKRDDVEYIIYGNKAHLERISAFLQLPLVGVKIKNHPIPQVEDVKKGEVQAKCGQASYDFLTSAIDDALSGLVDGIVTCPINKAALEAAGIHYPGHTEILVEKSGTQAHAMMLGGGDLNCSLVTTHISIAQVPKMLTKKRIVEVANLTSELIEKKEGRPAKLAILGLNPHAGENGLFGDEEERVIIPAIQEIEASGIEVIGPLPPDTAFLPEIRAKVDAHICMYHDQGLIPLKTLYFDEGINTTLGLPFIRTSVDHGTAFDIAWQGEASITSLVAAVNFAVL